MPWWNEPEPDAQEYQKRFEKGVAMTGAEFTDRCRYVALAWLPARDLVRKALADRFQYGTL